MTVSPDFPALVRIMTQDQTPRVWSLLITVFGDLGQKAGETISGGALNRLMEPIGIRPDAIRVALHRLRKDGWIESARQGRRSHYHLTKWGRSQSAQASPRIYATTGPTEPCWLVLKDPGSDTALPDDMHWATGTIGLRLGRAPHKEAIEVTTPVPAWVRIKLCPQDRLDACAQVEHQLRALSAALPASELLSPLQTTVLRVLIVHAWRRVVLRVPDLPDAQLPDGWRGAACRAHVADLLERLPRPPLATLEFTTPAQKA